MNNLIDSISPRGKVAQNVMWNMNMLNILSFCPRGKVNMRSPIKWYAYCVDKLNDTWLQSHKSR